MPAYQDLFREMRQSLTGLYDADEAAAIARLFMEQATGISYTRALTLHTNVPPVTTALIYEGMAALKSGRPIQYVLGRTSFCGHSFRCDERALIPRPETEELVEWIRTDVADVSFSLRILDVGTGTGCIAISLALAFPQAQVSALDYSAGALELARANAANLQATVAFRYTDFLNEVPLPDSYDILVSNPPYIPQHEAETLHANVRDFEPAMALFVPDNDALLFYRALALYGQTALAVRGAVYCEVHRDYAEATATLFQEAGYRNVVLKEDAFGAPRMLRALK